MNRFIRITLATLAALTLTLWISAPQQLNYAPPSSSDIDLNALLSGPIESSEGLVPGAEKRLLWAANHERTEWSVVALHGFSASRQESAPVAEMVAANLGANLFETRFSGHGLLQEGLVDVAAEQWLDDVAEALAIGRAIGDRIVIISVSTGSTLALAMLDHPAMQDVDSIIMISPNFAPADPKGLWITKPGGPLMLRLVAGPTRSWEAHNQAQETFWTTRYPSRTLIEVIRVVDRAHDRINKLPAPRIQIFYSPNDQVISVDALKSAFQKIRAPQKEIFEVLETGAPSAHILAGDIISPMNTVPLVKAITGFVRPQAPQASPE